MTGFFRDGCCLTGPQDVGSHTICAVVTAEFLDHQESIGNDLKSPVPEFGFPGLTPGDRWCVTAANWLRAHEDGAAALVVLASTHERALEIVPIEALGSTRSTSRGSRVADPISATVLAEELKTEIHRQPNRGAIQCQQQMTSPDHRVLDRHRSGDGRAPSAAGHTVYATARQAETLADLEAKGCMTMALDVTDEASMKAAVDRVETE